MDKVRLKVLGLSYSMSQTGAYALVLADEGDNYRIPIIIGISEAQSIAIQLEHLKTQRPLTHDLIKQIIDYIGVELVEVNIYRWESGIYYAELLFKIDSEEFKIDARTSDAVALALRSNSPIFVSREVMEKTAVSVQGGEVALKISTEPIKEDEPLQHTVEELQQLMKKAVEDEDYESASRYRDLLKRAREGGGDK